MSSEAIPAATLILVRDRTDGPPELLMVERPASMAFAPGALVFPGGRIDAADRRFAAGFGNADVSGRIAAIRETIEECAVPAGMTPAPSPEQLLAMQQALNSGEEFASLLPRYGMEIGPEMLTPFARWVPAHEVSRRFDTLFFIARADDRHGLPNVSGSECVSARWITAAAALEQERDGTAKLIYPTRKNLERLAQFDCFEAMLADAHRHPVVPITACVERVDGCDFVRIPDGLGYPLTLDRLDDVWRG